MDCLPKAAGALTDQIDGAKAAADGLIGDATSSVADLIKAQTDGIKGKLDELVPKIELPQANLQDEMSAMLANVNDPGKLAEKFAGMKDKFVGVNLDSIMDDIGLDSSKLNALDDKLKAGLDKIAGPMAKVEGAFASAQGAVEGAFDSALAGVMGGVGDLAKGGFDLAGISEGLCKSVPNIDLDAEGNLIKKGLPTTLPTVDAAKIMDAAKAKGESIIPKIKEITDLTKNVSIVIAKVEDK